MMALANSVTRLTENYGTAHTLRKENAGAGPNAWTKGAPAVTYNACKAKAKGYSPSEMRGAIQENDELLTVPLSSLPDGVTPARGDRIAAGIHLDDAADWRHVVNVHATKIAGVVISYRLQVRR